MLDHWASQLSSITIDELANQGHDVGTAFERRVLTASEFLELYVSRWPAAIETKSATAATRLLPAIRNYGLEPYVLVNSFDEDDLPAFAAAGCATLLIAANTTGLTPAQVAALGIAYVGIAGIPEYSTDAAALIAYLQPWVDEGLKIWGNADHRASWQLWVRAGAAGGFSDDPLWVSGAAERYITDQFASRRNLPGHIPYQAGHAGTFYDVDVSTVGWVPAGGTSTGWCLWGWLSPLPGSTTGDWDYLTGITQTVTAQYPIGLEVDVTLVFVAANPNRCASLVFADDDRQFTSTLSTGENEGLYFQINAAGSMTIGHRVDDNETVYGFSASLPIIQGQTVRIRCERLSDTQARMTRLDTNTVLTVTTDSPVGKGGFVHAGLPGAASDTGAWAFSSVQVIST